MVGGHARFCVLAGTIDLAVYMNDEGYAPRHVTGVAVSTGEEEPLRIELERGVDVRLKVDGAEPLPVERQRDHLIFLLHETQLDELRGPFPIQGGPSNCRINAEKSPNTSAVISFAPINADAYSCKHHRMLL